MSKKNLPKGHPKLCKAWAFYDWANSVYSLTIVSAIFPIFYAAILNKDQQLYLLGSWFKGFTVISIITLLGFLIVVLCIPVLASLADVLKNRKVFMKFFNYSGALCCLGLYFFDANNALFGLCCYLFALVGFWISLAFYNAYLPDIAYINQQDALSARGFSYGYIGSVLLLILNLLIVRFPSSLGLEGDLEGRIFAMRIAFLTVGVWWFLFGFYTYYYLPSYRPDISYTSKFSEFNTFRILYSKSREGFYKLLMTYRDLKSNFQSRYFLRAFFIYSMALQTIMLIATYYGEKEIEWETSDQKTTGLILSILLIQLVAILGAFLISRLVRFLGAIYVLILIVIVWVVVCLLAYYCYTPLQFYSIAGVVGFIMGGTQSLSRSTFSKYIPNHIEDTTAYFSFYDTCEKLSIITGLLFYTAIEYYFDSMRIAVLVLLFFFLLSLFPLWKLQKTSKFTPL